MSLKISLILAFVVFVQAKSLFAPLKNPADDSSFSAEGKEKSVGRFFARTRRAPIVNDHAKKIVSALGRSKRDIEARDEEVDAAVMGLFLSAEWKEAKAELLSGYLEEMTDASTNITVIGWQNLYGDDGEVKGVSTIRFVLPPKCNTASDCKADVSGLSSSTDDEDDDEDDRTLPHGLINELRESLETMEKLNVPAAVTFESFTKDGDVESQLYIDNDELFANFEGFHIYNRTIAEASPQKIEKIINGAKKSGLVSVLRYDSEGNLKAESEIEPVLLGGVMDWYEAPADMLLDAPKLVADVVANNRNKSQMAKELSEKFEEKYPKYQWRTLVDPEAFYVSRDVSLTLTYDNVDFYEDSDISYLVYGKLK